MIRRTLLIAVWSASTFGCMATGDRAVPVEPSFAAGGNVDMTSRVRYSWADSVNVGTVAVPQWVPAGWRGDDRMRDGSPSTPALSNEYQGNFCGVWAVIYPGTRGGNGNLDIMPARQWTTALPASCQPARYDRVFLDGPESAPGITRAQTKLLGIETMALGETRSQAFKSGTLVDLPVGLWYDDDHPPASNVLITRLPNITDEFGRSVRQWRIETQGSHRAMGVVQSSGKKGGQVPTGTTYYLPFVLTVTEVPYPFPSFP